MRLELLSSLTGFALSPPQQVTQTAISVLYLILLLAAIYRYRSDLTLSTAPKVTLFLLLTALGLAAPLIVRLHVPAGGWDWLGTAAPQSAGLVVPLLVMLPILAAAIWLGHGPAALIGLLSGLAYAGSLNLTMVQVLEGALSGVLLALFLRQRYRGSGFHLLRQPLIAGPLVGLALWPLPLYAGVMNPTLWAGGMPALALTTTALPGLIVGALAGGIVQVILAIAPGVRPDMQINRTPPYHRSIAGRLLSQLIPATLIVAVISLIVLNVVTMRIAFDRTLQQMEDTAVDTTVRLDNLVQSGVMAIDNLVAEGRFVDTPANQWPALLVSTTNDESPFHEILLLDRNAQIVALQPSGLATAHAALSEAEIEALNLALAQDRTVVGRVFQLDGATPALPFVTPIIDAESREIRGVLLGRTILIQSVDIDLLLNSIGNRSIADRAYLIDGQGNVILRAGEQTTDQVWVANADPVRRYEPKVGQAYEELAASGDMQIVYWLRVSRPDWHLVLERDRASVTQAAVDMARPLLFTLAGLFILLTSSTVMIVQLQLVPLRHLSSAAAAIAGGDPKTSVPAYRHRDDEVGQLSRAIQSMAAGLGAGGEDLARLVEVSQNVSSRANLTHTLQTILRGITVGMDALAVGMHHFNANGSIWSQTREGRTDLPADVDLYLEHLSKLVWRNSREILISNVASESSEMPRVLLLRAGICSLVVIPMRREDKVLGTLWAAWPDRKTFSKLDTNYIAALGNLAGIMIANNQIYRAVESERSRLATILNSTRDGILVTDAKGQLQLANPAAEELLGIDLAKVYQKPLPTIISDENLFRMLSDIARRGRSTATTELQRQGQRLYVSASPILLADRQSPQGWVLVMRDITDVKRLDDMKSDFLETVAHDMKSPLSYASGYAGLLMDESLSKTQLEYVEKIRKGIDTLTQLINELSDLGKIANRVDMTMSPCQLVNVVREVVDNYRPYVEDKGLTFHAELPADLPMVIGDNRWLKRAVSNLVDNAIKYTMSPGWIKVSVQELSSSLGVIVADSGIGISPANRRRIFEKFYRVRHRDTLHVQGTGLGLAMVKTIAEQHGGQVAVESELGAGSVFYLTLPKERPIADFLDEDGLFPADGAPRGGVAADPGGASVTRYDASTRQSESSPEDEVSSFLEDPFKRRSPPTPDEPAAGRQLLD